MRRIACLVTLASLFTLAPEADAQPQVAVEATPAPPPGDRRTEIDLGYMVGGGGIGTRDRFQRGVSAAIGRRFGDALLLGEYDYLAIGRAEATGSESRFGALLRYSLLRTRGTPDERGERSPMSGDMWIEGGAGYERITWDTGGTLRRPDVVLGFGAQLDGVFRRASDEPSWFGPFVAFRAVLARSPDDVEESDVTCGGPCDAPGHPSPNDVALFFHFGVNWGR